MSSRTLKLTSPAMRGSDVELFQRDVNAELKRWDIPRVLKVDGVYGTETRDVAKSVCFGLGLASPVMEHGATPAIRLKVRNRKLNAAELKRYKSRGDWRGRLAKRYDGPDDAIRAAVAYAVAHIGVTEHPANSNTGPQVDKWCRACGVYAAPWCGCFVNACLVAAGFPDEEWLRYCPSVEGVAKSGQGGWSWHSTAEIGDVILYGRAEAEHQGLVEDVEHGRDTATIEGNTTNGLGGDQANGGIVARRHRHTDGSLIAMPVRGYARPPWSKAA